MAKSQNKDSLAYFLSFCVEIYKNAHSMTGGEAAAVLADSGVLTWLGNNYDVIHTQSYHWILEEIEDFLSTNQKVQQ